ncbi:protein RKD2-like [Phalaenopsis equestris]|uniref:protein RKD2-like n=1 Tax=Phalaenopsis equestris TaxID=78828 RepID=UPI0009E1E763|nr:protein RKD2-like [Phalaenopsis equestris]
MDIETDIQSYISWPMFEETSFSMPYLDENNLIDFAPTFFNDSYDLLPLPETLEHRAIPISYLPPFSEKLHCSEEIMNYYTEAMPLSTVTISSQTVMEENAAEEMEREVKSLMRGRKAKGKRMMRSCELGLEEIRGYFNMPITRAAMEMNIGLTVLKKRCRELGITRWPHRKLKSLNTLITNIQEIGKCSSDENIKEELKSLEKHKRLMEENPEIQLTEETKKLRQACFKANYKRRVVKGIQAALRETVALTNPKHANSSGSQSTTTQS